MAEESMKDFEQEINDSFKTAKKVESEDNGKWDRFAELIETKEQFDVKIIEVVKGGCIAYLEDTRAFIPASQLSTSYVEKLEDFQGKHIKVVVITADPEKKRLVLSHRAIEQAEKDAAKAERLAQIKVKAERLAQIKVGDVLDGKVETIKDYGAFVDLGGDATGLLHVSQISRKRVKTPADVLQEGQEIKVKVIKVGDGKISLSMRALEEPEQGARDFRSDRAASDEPQEDYRKFVAKEKATTNLGDLLKGIKLN